MLAGELWNCLWKHIGGGQMQRSALQVFPRQGPFSSKPLKYFFFVVHLVCFNCIVLIGNQAMQTIHLTAYVCLEALKLE